ncbi:MAG: alpha-ketoacid dehydrogenase subunit beta [Chloroflexi bacterium AL-W]|nr:alpha-ketoacid dehydrogenase subunit beta [Chloroflexi bacterium AL-N1]NOK68712.1 alpha-ketoacid dehydrogenase subunit beta [Chloroflexi bacterium AL-N10]NOK76198.1 alpha-ketoacid dehydrogenase subunit beta [Chloroflexi bacterium AL-N5]NOK84165.1 alpha-ketoacid dehydrogenase subunit beta [Chloroflexi bacterium AL-W]NOK91336.1 alpha-ketoacid dehydrogenase subunit beta [Chloroflexi bacterium AL-N15]
MAEITLLESIRSGLDEIMAIDDRVFVFGEDVGKRGGVFRVTEGLYEKYGPMRIIDAPLAESVIVGACIGASFNDTRPVAEIQFADFIHPSFNQIVSEAARVRYRSNGDWGVPMVIRAPYGGGIHGALYHSQSIEALFCHIPGLKVVAPSTPYDAKGLLKTSIEDPDPVLFLEHKKCYRLIKGAVPEEDYRIPIGKADIKRTGSDLTVIAYGLMMHHSLEAAKQLAQEGIEAEIIDLRTLRPLDVDAILESVVKTSKVLIVHEDNLTGGLGGEISALISEHAFEHLDGPIRRVCGPDSPAMPYAKTLEDAFFPSVEQIADAMRELAAY